jgi:hypothetical protein
MHKMGGRVTVFAVFAVLPTNYQRSTSRSPRKSWAAEGSAMEKQRDCPLFCRCFPLFCDTDAKNCKDGATGGSQSPPNP